MEDVLCSNYGFFYVKKNLEAISLPWLKDPIHVPQCLVILRNAFKLQGASTNSDSSICPCKAFNSIYLANWQKICFKSNVQLILHNFPAFTVLLLHLQYNSQQARVDTGRTGRSSTIDLDGFGDIRCNRKEAVCDCAVSLYLYSYKLTNKGVPVRP